MIQSDLFITYLVGGHDSPLSSGHVESPSQKGHQDSRIAPGNTPWKFNSSPLKINHPKRKVIFQPSFFRGELLNFGGVCFCNFFHSSSRQIQGLWGRVLPKQSHRRTFSPKEDGGSPVQRIDWESKVLYSTQALAQPMSINGWNLEDDAFLFEMACFQGHLLFV